MGCARSDWDFGADVADVHCKAAYTLHFRKLQKSVQTFCDETWPALYTFENSPASHRSQSFVPFIGETLIPVPK